MYCVTQYKHSVRRILGYIDIPFSALFLICLNVFTLTKYSHIQRVRFVLCVQARGTHVLLLTIHQKQI